MENEKKFYKVYIGDYYPVENKLCAAPSIYATVPYIHLGRTVGEVVNNLHKGLDCYIVTPNGKIFAWHRDLVKLSKEERRQVLNPN